MKRIHIETLGNRTAKVYRDSAWNEFRVRLYLDGKLHAPADYFTGEKADAIETAFAMVRPPKPAPLSVAFNCAVLHIVSKLLPCGFDVSADAPQDFDSLVAHHAETGRVLVWNGASDQTIFADAEVNFAFRAWHDSKHITGGFPFTFDGEMSALNAQKADVNRLYDGETAAYFCTLLDAEIYGQWLYQQTHGGFPLDQYGFAAAYISQGSTAAIGARPLFGVSLEAG